MFEVIVKKSLFASHKLTNESDDVWPPHDHHWIIEAKFRSDKLDVAGCAIDFRVIDTTLQEILLPYQNKTLNALKPFKNTSPSAENVAKHIFELLSKSLGKNGVFLASITAWEDMEHGAAYTL